MGSDKAALIYRGETLLDRMLTFARQACDKVVISGSQKRYGSFGEVVEDIEPGHGPLSGIHSALHATRTSLNLILSVDMPMMEPAFLNWLLVQADSGEQIITVPNALGQMQPLCAVYRSEIRPAVDDALVACEYKVTALFRRVSTRVIGEAEICAAGFNPGIFTNVNTPEEYSSLMQPASSTQAKVSHE